jgi:hypothetical protein
MEGFVNSIALDTVAERDQARKMAEHYRQMYYRAHLDRQTLELRAAKDADLINYLRNQLERLTEACVVRMGETGPELAIHHEPWQAAVDAMYFEEAPPGWVAVPITTDPPRTTG